MSKTFEDDRNSKILALATKLNEELLKKWEEVIKKKKENPEENNKLIREQIDEIVMKYLKVLKEFFVQVFLHKISSKDIFKLMASKGGFFGL